MDADHPLLTLVAIASHESRFLVEWLTYHRLAGVAQFILLDIIPGGDQGGDDGDANVPGESLAELLAVEGGRECDSRPSYLGG